VQSEIGELIIIGSDQWFKCKLWRTDSVRSNDRSS